MRAAVPAPRQVTHLIERAPRKGDAATDIFDDLAVVPRSLVRLQLTGALDAEPRIGKMLEQLAWEEMWDAS